VPATPAKSGAGADGTSFGARGLRFRPEGGGGTDGKVSVMPRSPVRPSQQE